MEVLSQLVDKSLVMVREAGQERRYSLLETMRQYGAEKLTAAGEVTRLRTRHQEWYLALAQQAEPDLYGPQQVVWLERLEPELDNLRAALAWRDPAEAERWLGLRLARALFWFFYPGRYLSEGRAWFEKALAETSPGQRTWVRAMALYGGGILAMYQGDLITANERLTESSTIWRTLDQANLANPELNSRQELAMALFGLGTVRLNQGDESTAQTLLEECLESFQALGQETLYGIALMHLGDVALGQGDWATARICYQACLTIQRKLAYHWGMAQALNNLGEVARCQADYAQAAQFYRESQALFQQLGSGADVARSMHNLGYVALAHDQAPGSASRLTPWPRLAGSRTGLPTSHLGRRETQQKPNSLPHDPSPGEG
jgi:tetratricopeptide (TPR) repeat protein